MYRTGFINKNVDTYIRMKQGLPVQELASLYRQPSSKYYYPHNLNSFQVCNHANMYPLNMPEIYYGVSPVEPDYEALKYIQAP